MKSDMLAAETERLQHDYRDVLCAASSGMLEDPTAIVDELKAFWYTNRHLVDCILKYSCKANEGYVFTGATYVDVANNEHYPFIALGRSHFVDDPILRFSEVVEGEADDRFKDRLRKLIDRTTADNIEIIQRYSGAMTILPIRYLAPVDPDIVHKAATKAFFSMFESPMDFPRYQADLRSAADIQRVLKPGTERRLVLSEDDDRSLSLQDRLDLYKQEAALPFGADLSDAAVFWTALYGYFAQAFDIMMMCLQYQMVPYVRYSVAAGYLFSLSENFEQDADIQDMLFRSAVAHVLYRSFEITKVEKVGFENYRKSLLESSFSNQVFEGLASAGITLSSFDVPKIVTIIRRNMDAALGSMRPKQVHPSPSHRHHC